MNTQHIRFFLFLTLPIAFISTVSVAETWTGNGSIINYHWETYGSNDTATNTPYGLSSDVSATHPEGKTGNTTPVAFFQWQLSQNCKHLSFNYDESTNSSKKANITIGGWSSRENDLTYENVTLPFVVGKDNGNTSGVGWYVAAVSILDIDTTKVTNISATCTAEPVTEVSTQPTKGVPLMLEGTHQWNGTASIINGNFLNASSIADNETDNWPYGVTKDVTKVHPGEKPAVFFQWYSSKFCSKLKLSATNLPEGEKKVSLRYKGWEHAIYKSENITLPYTLNGTKKPVWTVLGLYFDSPVSKEATVLAECEKPVINSSPDLFKTSWGGSGQRFNGDSSSDASIFSYETTYNINVSGIINRLKIQVDNGNSDIYLHPMITVKHNGIPVSITPTGLSYDEVGVAGMIQLINLDSDLTISSGDTFTIKIRAGTHVGDDSHHWNIGVTDTLGSGISSMSSRISHSSGVPDTNVERGIILIAERVINQ
jgi:hypothetical protein